MTRDAPLDQRGVRRGSDGLLDNGFVKMMAPVRPGRTIDVRAARGKNPVPGPRTRSGGNFPVKRPRKLDADSARRVRDVFWRFHAESVFFWRPAPDDCKI